MAANIGAGRLRRRVLVVMGYRRGELVAARKAAGFTQEGLAGALHVDRSTVIRWEAGDNAPWPYLWPRLARLLGVAPERVAELVAGGGGAGEVEQFAGMCGWLDQRAGWAAGTARRRLAGQVGRLRPGVLAAGERRRAQVGHGDLVAALRDYYVESEGDFGRYGVRVGEQAVRTSVLVRPGWLNVGYPLVAGAAGFDLAQPPTCAAGLDAGVGRAAVARLAEVSATGVRMVDAHLYRLLDVDVGPGGLGGTFAAAGFTEYALTMDLLERELVDAVAAGNGTGRGELPLRDVLLPDVGAVVRPAERVCMGGVLALCAIARPGGDGDSGPDYVLLTQRRSDQVVNAQGRLSVVPKGFHQPITEPRRDVQLQTTLRRELEEELFARSDVDPTFGECRVADPMHRSRLSEPLRWLEERDAVRMECTGFGYNLVSGNYEFAALVVVDDPEFWTRFGGVIEANWETAGFRLCSSRDRAAVAELLADPSWASEGLFAFVEGIRRLREVGGRRADLPAVEALGV